MDDEEARKPTYPGEWVDHNKVQKQSLSEEAKTEMQLKPVVSPKTGKIRIAVGRSHGERSLVQASESKRLITRSSETLSRHAKVRTSNKISEPINQPCLNATAQKSRKTKSTEKMKVVLQPPEVVERKRNLNLRSSTRRKRRLVTCQLSDVHLKSKFTETKIEQRVISADSTDTAIYSSPAIIVKPEINSVFIANSYSKSLKLRCSSPEKSPKANKPKSISSLTGRMIISSNHRGVKRKENITAQRLKKKRKVGGGWNTELQSNKRGILKSRTQVTGSSHNPIYLDSDEKEKDVIPLGVAVDQICIGQFSCRRNHFDPPTDVSFPSVRCDDSHFTLHVWKNWHANNNEKETETNHEIVVEYSSLNYAAFGKKRNSGFCVFTMSTKPREILDTSKNSATNLLENFRNNSKNLMEKSIVIVSSREEQITLIKKQFLKLCPDVMKKLLKPKRGKKKPGLFLKAHGIRLKPSFCIRNKDARKNVFGNSAILLYPKQESSHGAIILTENDISRLRPHEYLNDNLIDFYLRYLYLEKWDTSLRHRVHLFNTFFFKKWINRKKRKGEPELEFDLSRYAGVKKWTKNVDIFSKDFLIVPVNYKLHWSLGIVCFPGNVMDENHTTDRRCCILGFDSLRKFRSSHFKEIKRYLNMAWCTRGVGLPTVACARELPFNNERCACIPLRTPSQRNDKDCGVFLLHNCESFFDKGGLADYTKPSPGVNWYPSSDISEKRINIIKLISRMCGLNLSKRL